MSVGLIWRSHPNFSLVLMAIMVTSLGGAAFACDHGTPIDPEVLDDAVSINFGGSAGQMQDIARSVEAREVMEPQLTAMLTMGELDAFPGRVVATSMQPTISSWFADLGRSVTLVSRMAMAALTRCL
jgi:hypothetical protein